MVPELAERWEADPSARRYRFYLRRGVTFHDGVPLTRQRREAPLRAAAGPEGGLAGPVDLQGGGGRDGLPRRPERRRSRASRSLDEHDAGDPPRRAQGLLPAPASPCRPRRSPGMDAAGTLAGHRARSGRSDLDSERRGPGAATPTYFRAGPPAAGPAGVPAVAPDRQTRSSGSCAGEVDVVSGLYAEHVRTRGAGVRSRSSPAPRPRAAFLGFNLRDAALRRRARAAGASAPGWTCRALVEQFHPGRARGAHAHPARAARTAERAARRPRRTSRWRAQLLREAGMRTAAADAVPTRPGATPRPRTRCSSAR